MKNKKTKLLALLLAAAMSLTLLAGCGKDGGNGGNDNTGGQTGEGDPGEPKQTVKDTIVIATANETPSLHPFAHNSVAGTYMNDLTYSTLFRTDADLKPAPNLVDTYENLDDTTWQFKLKQGVKFHNGSELKAEDVKASIEWAKTFSEINMYNNSVESVEVVDDYTFIIHTPTPSATLLYDLCHHGNCILPKDLIEAEHDFNTEPIGSGPYKFVSWSRGDSLEFEAFDEYFLGAPAIPHMTWKVVPEGSSRTIALEAGEVDFVVEVEAMDTERIESNPDLTMLQHEATNVTWLMLNNERPGLDNVNVRHAINCAINKESVVTVALNDIGHPLLSQCPNGMLGSSEENADQYDPAKAKEWLEKSGLEPESIEFSIICSNDQKKRAAEVIQADLAQVGIHCEIESMDLATYLSVTTEGNYTASIGGYNSSEMVNYMVGVYTTGSINASNTTRYSNPEVDALIAKAASTVDDAEREQILLQTTALLNAECPQAPLWQSVNQRAYNANLEGVAINAGGSVHFEDVSWKA